MSVTALTSHEETWPCVVYASVGLVHHSLSAPVRLLLSPKAAPGRIGGGKGGGGEGGGKGGSGGESGGGGEGGGGGVAGGKKGVLHQAEAHESSFQLAHAENAWAMKLV